MSDYQPIIKNKLKMSQIPTYALLAELEDRGLCKTAFIRQPIVEGQIIDWIVKDAKEELGQWVAEHAVHSEKTTHSYDKPGEGTFEARITVILKDPEPKPTSSISEPTENPDAFHGHVGSKPKATGGLG